MFLNIIKNINLLVIKITVILKSGYYICIILKSNMDRFCH